MGNCKNCKHWATQLNPLDPRLMRMDLPSYCFDAMRQGSGGICIPITEEESVLATQVVNGDYAESSAVLYTVPDFGCVLFEAREVTA